MDTLFSYPELYRELESSLLKSTPAIRKIWVSTIIDQNIKIEQLAGLLKCEHKIAIRFLWLLSEIGMESPVTLHKALPHVLNLCDQINPVYKQSFANYWLIAGIPPEQENTAIDLCFQWLLSGEANITIKSRSIWVLQKLCKKYPELKNELKIVIEDLADNYSKDFEKRVRKVLKEL